MTGCAVHPKLTFMRLIVIVTGMAILGRDGEVSKTACIDMTLYTGNTSMFPRQRERELVVIEILPQMIDAIVTVQAGGSKR